MTTVCSTKHSSLRPTLCFNGVGWLKSGAQLCRPWGHQLCPPLTPADLFGLSTTLFFQSMAWCWMSLSRANLLVSHTDPHIAKERQARPRSYSVNHSIGFDKQSGPLRYDEKDWSRNYNWRNSWPYHISHSKRITKPHNCRRQRADELNDGDNKRTGELGRLRERNNCWHGSQNKRRKASLCWHKWKHTLKTRLSNLPIKLARL